MKRLLLPPEKRTPKEQQAKISQIHDGEKIRPYHTST
jgi:hypothetical protein